MTPIDDTNETKDHDKMEDKNVTDLKTVNPYLDLNNFETIKWYLESFPDKLKINRPIEN